MREFNFVVNGNDYKVKIVSFKEDEKASNDIAIVSVNGIEYEVGIAKQESKTPIIKTKPLVQTTVERSNITNRDLKVETTVKAPIPGLVLQINCKVGDNVKMGDTILMLEAMKMQNEIQASKDGIIKEVKVSAGQNVLEGDVLVVIE